MICGTCGESSEGDSHSEWSGTDNDEFQDCEVYVTVTVDNVKIQFAAYVDTACAKSCMSHAEFTDIKQYCEDNDWPCRVVTEKEPFRFGPGTRIWSEEALIIPVVWANQVVVLRISVIPKRVPCLLSKTVFKTLRCALDLDDNEAIFKLFPNPKAEPLYDIPSGHVVIEMLKAKPKTIPQVDASAWAACEGGKEVTVNDPVLREKMATVATSNGIHKVDYRIESEDESSDCDSQDYEDYCNPVGNPASPKHTCLLYTSPSPRDRTRSRMPSSA